jgi:hypothetical protein
MREEVLALMRQEAVKEEVKLSKPGHRRKHFWIAEKREVNASVGWILERGEQMERIQEENPLGSKSMKQPRIQIPVC